MIAALTKKPQTISPNATTTSPSTRWPASAAPICARFSAPVRPYSSAIPNSTKKPPIALLIPKFSAPCNGARWSERCAVRAIAVAVISSKKTNMLNRSPLSQKPMIAAIRTSSSAGNACPTDSK